MSQHEHAVDWDAAVNVAEHLGRRTLTLVARRDADAVRSWALGMARQFDNYAGHKARVASYLELAVLCGHEQTTPELAVDEAKDEGALE
jgi:hypothetical protein